MASPSWNGSAHSWTASFSPAYAGTQNDDQATSPRSNFSNSSPVPPNLQSTSTTPLSPTAAPPRRRRRFGRMIRAGSDTFPRSTLSIFNPEAADFIPAKSSNMQTKKKSYSFSKPSRLEQANHISAPIPLPNNVPTLKASDIFHGDSMPLPTPVVLKPAEGTCNVGDLTHDYDHYTTLRGYSVDNTFVSGSLRRLNRHLHRLKDYNDDTCSVSSNKTQSAILIHQDGDSAHSSKTNCNGLSGRRLRYLPLVPLASVQNHHSLHSQDLTILPSHRDRIDHVGDSSHRYQATWPANVLPPEIFDLITQYLARDDTMAMRMVNREFEEKVSRSLFYCSVVPFNTELYDMIDENTKSHTRTQISKGKGKSKKYADSHLLYMPKVGTETGGLLWQNAKNDEDGKVYKGHGLRVFQGFGPHIKRFGMSFEVSEDQLAHPPAKKELDHIDSYHGPYTWPQRQYARFDNLAGLEQTADETSRMKAAFANLEIVQELALSIDSGLGWLNGADKSVRARIFDRPSAVFGRSSPVPDLALQEANELWTALKSCVRGLGSDRSDKEINLKYTALPSTLANIGGLHGSKYADTTGWSSFDARKIFTTSTAARIANLGVLAVTSGPLNSPHGALDFGDKPASFPAELKKEQKEWLMETEWAQRAFLESYMLAIVDNPSNFQQVTTLRVAKLSSRYIQVLARESFWDALPSLKDMTLHISADWRTVEKDNAGFAETRAANPSHALRHFHDILQDRIAPRTSVKRLNVGWIGGGERAEGMFARNAHLLPSPITSRDNCAVRGPYIGLILPHVEHLTLTNCWVTPPVLEGFIHDHADKALVKLTLDSVSLTAHPGTSTNLPGAGNQPFAQALAAVQAQLAQAAHHHPGAQAPQGFPQMQNLFQGANPQQWHAQAQQMLHQFHPNFHQGPIAGPATGAGNFITQLTNFTTAHAPVANGPSNSSTPPGGIPGQHWTEGYRLGSWPDVINSISPGCVLNDFRPPPAPWENPLPPRRATALRTIELKSCGYAKISHASNPPFDQSVFDTYLAALHAPSPWFNLRANALKSSMLESRDRYLAHIVPWMPPREQDCLNLAWGLTMGWSDPTAAEEAEYDGLPPGGSGRVSGTIQAGVGASYELAAAAE